MRLFVGIVLGIALGASLAAVVVTSLFEIGTNLMFAAMFGIALFFMGACLLIRVLSSGGARPGSKAAFVCVGCGVLLAGALCFVQAVFELSSLVMLALFSWIATTLAFALVFTFSEVAAMAGWRVATSEREVWALQSGGAAVGFVCGALFWWRLGRGSAERELAVVNAVSVALSALVGGGTALVAHYGKEESSPNDIFEDDDFF